MKKIKHKVDHKVHHKVVAEFSPVDFYARYQKLIIGVVISIVLVIVGTTAVLLWFRSQEREANIALTQAVSSEDLDTIIKRFPHTKMKPVAMIEWAADLYQQGSYTQAQTVYRQFAKGYASHPLLPAALAGEAYCYESLGDYVKAEDLFRKISRDYPQTIWGEEATEGAARIAQFGEKIVDRKKEL